MPNNSKVYEDPVPSQYTSPAEFFGSPVLGSMINLMYLILTAKVLIAKTPTMTSSFVVSNFLWKADKKSNL
jgi:hypothetical protein